MDSFARALLRAQLDSLAIGELYLSMYDRLKPFYGPNQRSLEHSNLTNVIDTHLVEFLFGEYYW